MKLGSKSRDVESFVDQLKSEGENVSHLSQKNTPSAGPMKSLPSQATNTEEWAQILCKLSSSKCEFS